MTRNAPRLLALLAVALTVTMAVGHAHAQSSLGIGVNDGTATTTGPFAHILIWINQRQQQFYRALATAMKAMREDGSKVWVLVGLSFLYGIFHAAGPGHGKAVISSYMVANNVALRRGIMLSFVSALLQGVTALVIMLLAYFVLRGTAISMTETAVFMEKASYVAVTLFGAWLLWKKAWPAVSGLFTRSPAYNLSAAAAGTASGRQFNSSQIANRPRLNHPDAGLVPVCGHDLAGDATCQTCGHAHLPDPSLLGGDRFDWRTAWSAVAAVGIRPCSGALIVLSFAFLNGMWTGGILSVAAMSVGTAMTVSLLAILAVTAKDWAMMLAGDGRIGNRIHTVVEIGGAALVFVFGLLLLTASMRPGG